MHYSCSEANREDSREDYATCNLHYKIQIQMEL